MEKKPVLLLLIGLLVGVTVGYYFGLNSISTVKDDREIAEESQVVTENNTQDSDVSASANPYAKLKEAANPFKDSSYQNPFAQ